VSDSTNGDTNDGAPRQPRSSSGVSDSVSPRRRNSSNVSDGESPGGSGTSLHRSDPNYAKKKRRNSSRGSGDWGARTLGFSKSPVKDEGEQKVTGV
jgi:hypothetical protein